MKVIFKYLLRHGITGITLPVHYRILAVNEQDGHPFVWIEHKEPAPADEITQIRIVGRATGERWKAENTGRYLDSAFNVAGNLVFHFYLL